MQYATMGMILPETREETSWTAVNRDEFIRDMQLVGQEVEKQVEVDTPRVDLQIQEKNSCVYP